jgi:hypothetical protein
MRENMRDRCLLASDALLLDARPCLSKHAAARVAALASLLLVVGQAQCDVTERKGSVGVPVPGPSRAGFYVTPTGSASGDGSATRPWDLPTALAGGRGRVQPGDTIWLRDGTYAGTFTGNLNGTAARPIIVRQYPGERATLLGNGGVYSTTLTMYGSNTWYWGFEVVGSPTSIGYCIDPRGTDTKVINVVAHDILNVGVGMGLDGIGTELYGTIVYNIGPFPDVDLFAGYANSYALYIGNRAGTPTKTVRDNIFFNLTSYGIHAYNTSTHVHNITFEGNAVFNAGLIKVAPELLLLADGSTNITFANNYTYGNRHGRAAIFNDGPASSRSITVTGNFFHGTAQFAPATTATVANNTFYATDGNVLTTKGAMAGWTWGMNSHYRSAAATAWRHDGGNATLAGWKSATGRGATDANPGTVPTGTQVIVRPNAYEAGRANIIIYNWAQAANVNVDLSAVLRVGQAYTIVNAQNFYGAPVASGVYAGGAVSLPMAPVQSPAPLYASYTRPVTGPTFQVFVVRPVAEAPPKRPSR